MGCGKLVRFAGGVAVQAFLVKDHGNAEPGIFDEKFLDGVGEFRHLLGGSAQPWRGGGGCGIAGTADLAEAMTFFEGGLRLLGIKIAFGVQQFGGFFLPDAHHLRGFFFQRHAREEIFNAAFGGNVGVFVNGRFRGLGWHVSGSGRRYPIYIRGSVLLSRRGVGVFVGDVEGYAEGGWVGVSFVIHFEVNALAV